MSNATNMSILGSILNALLADDRNGLLSESDKHSAKRLDLFRTALLPYKEVRSVQSSKLVQKYGLVEKIEKIYDPAGVGHGGHQHTKACIAFFLLDIVIQSGNKDARNRGRLASARQILTRDCGVKFDGWLQELLENPRTPIATKAMDLKGFVLNFYLDVVQGQLDCFDAAPAAHKLEVK